MWQLILERLALELARKDQNGVAKEFGRRIAAEFSNGELNKDEAYADRIKREFRLRDYYQAWSPYDSDRAYWKQLYGDDPLNSQSHPASPPGSLVPREPVTRDRGDNYLDPRRMESGTPGPLATGGRFEPGSAAAPRPLYDTRSFAASSDNAAPSVAPIPFVGGTTRAQQVLDNSLPAPGVAPWDLSDRFGNWNGLGGVFGPAR